MYEDMECMTPAAGNTIPSRHRRGVSHGADVDSILKDMDQEDILRKVSTYPSHERKMMLKILRQQYRNRA